MSAIRYVMVGGFLGAGKTTTVARLARMFQDRGQRVGIVTNDQAADLVDTQSLRSQGWDVGEVSGACFCCHFNELTKTMEGLEERRRPDVLLAEPVGSCTDLVATVLQPISCLFGAKFRIAPYSVILKPSHGRRILRGESKAGFSPNAAYIFNKQLEEADVILINRCDELSALEASELESLLKEKHPDTAVMRISAKTGQGFDALFDVLHQEGVFGQKILDLDYDVYAVGEAELGWLNASMEWTSATPMSLDAILLEIVDLLREKLDIAHAETAHLKTIGLSEGYYGVANLVHRQGAAELSLPSDAQVTHADVIINARVAIDPAELETLVRSAVEEAAARRSAEVTFRQLQSFRPGRPMPTHRVVEIGRLG
jgi:Ni2+-binding GTPase involved in maturation of urease and hydrogenase